jgi:mRNA interferase YafQ
MRALVRTTQFERDFKRRVRTAKDEAALRVVLQCLIHEQPLALRHRDHPLKGEWSGVRDCHVRPDLLLLYSIEGDTVILHRLGTHSDLFG